MIDMKKYRAILNFYDLWDAQRFYRAGETYPRPGLNVPESRLDALAGDGNRMGYPLIVAVDDTTARDDRPGRRSAGRKGG